jgi:cytochrome c oxidase subunit 2
VCVVVYILVILTLVIGVLRRRHGQAADAQMGGHPITEPDPHRERRLWTVVSGCIFVSVITLFVLLIADFVTGRKIHAMESDPDPLRIQVTGNQWWWRVNYLVWPGRFGPQLASNGVETANEIHVPVGVTVEILTNTADVIHSFWVPNLHGKMDLIPQHPASIRFRVDQPGVYWGECAEYCGYQHAQMRLVVVAESEEKFKAWLDKQREPASEPTDPELVHGRDVMLRSTCIMCHAVNGTVARGRLGPDLTHVGGRIMLAAGAIPNAPGHMAGWIADPQRIKPGAKMPQNNIPPDDLRAVMEYLESLK